MMRLDMSTSQIVALLLRRGYNVHSPIIVRWEGEVCQIQLRSNSYAEVYRDDKGAVWVQVNTVNAKTGT